MNSVTTLLIGTGIGLILSSVLRRSTVVRQSQSSDPPFVAAPVIAHSGTSSVTIVRGTGNKITDIKAVRSCTHLGLKDAKDVIDHLPTELLRGVSDEYASAVARQLEAAGLTVKVAS